MAKKGEHISEETKLKMKESAKKVWSSSQLKKKQSLSQKGEKNSMWGKENKWGHHTPESNKKNSESNKGRIPWNKGVPCREETKIKLSKANKGNPCPMKGKKHSEATKKKMSENHADFSGEKSPMFGKPMSNITKEKIKLKRAKQVLPLKDSSIEVKIQNFLKQLEVEFFTHQYIKIKHGYQCDILIPSKNLVIECDGDYWHKYPIGNEIDHIRTKELIEKGFKVLRLWEHKIKKMTLDEFKEIFKNDK